MGRSTLKLVGVYEAWSRNVRQGRLTRASGTEVPVLVRVHDDLAATPEVLARLRDDARLLGRLQHESVLRLEHVSAVGGKVGEVYEGFDCASAARILRVLRARNQVLPARAAVEAAAAVGLAIDEALRIVDGDRSVVHLGPVPDEVLVDTAGRVKLAGFRVIRPGDPPIAAPKGYLAPEGAAGPAAATYLVGALLVELLSGEAPPEAAADPERHEAAVRRALIRVLARPGDTPGDPVVQAIRQAVAHEPAIRGAPGAFGRKLRELAVALQSPGLRSWAPGSIPSVQRFTSAPAEPRPTAGSMLPVPTDERTLIGGLANNATIAPPDGMTGRTIAPPSDEPEPTARVSPRVPLPDAASRVFPREALGREAGTIVPPPDAAERLLGSANPTMAPASTGAPATVPGRGPAARPSIPPSDARPKDNPGPRPAGPEVAASRPGTAEPTITPPRPAPAPAAGSGPAVAPRPAAPAPAPRPMPAPSTVAPSPSPASPAPTPAPRATAPPAGPSPAAPRPMPPPSTVAPAPAVAPTPATPAVGAPLPPASVHGTSPGVVVASTPRASGDPKPAAAPAPKPPSPLPATNTLPEGTPRGSPRHSPNDVTRPAPGVGAPAPTPNVAAAGPSLAAGPAPSPTPGPAAGPSAAPRAAGPSVGGGPRVGSEPRRHGPVLAPIGEADEAEKTVVAESRGGPVVPLDPLALQAGPRNPDLVPVRSVLDDEPENTASTRKSGWLIPVLIGMVVLGGLVVMVGVGAWWVFGRVPEEALPETAPIGTPAPTPPDAPPAAPPPAPVEPTVPTAPAVPAAEAPSTPPPTAAPAPSPPTSTPPAPTPTPPPTSSQRSTSSSPPARPPPEPEPEEDAPVRISAKSTPASTPTATPAPAETPPATPPPETTPAAPAYYHVEFTAGDPSVTTLEVKCSSGTAVGSPTVAMDQVPKGNCRVTGRGGDAPLITMVTVVADRNYTCFADRSPSCR